MSTSPNEELAELLTLLAHDLKNPLAAVLTNLAFVRGFVEDVGEGSIDPASSSDAGEAIVDALLACEALQRFVSNLELVSRDLAPASATGGDGPPLDLSAIADEIAGRQREAAASRRVSLVVDAAAATWARGERDPALRAADNVVANAIQHAPAGTEVRLVVAPHGDDVALVVVDRGAVVPPSVREVAVSRAGQARAKGRPEARYGRGLGLYAAALAARAAGGRLELGEREGDSALILAFPRFEENG